MAEADEAARFFADMQDGTLADLLAWEASDLSHVDGPVGYRFRDDRRFEMRYGDTFAEGSADGALSCWLLWGDRRMFH